MSAERRGRLGAFVRPVSFGFLLHPLEPFVVVGELLHVREGDLAGDDRIVAGDVCLRIVAAVLEFNVHAGAKLLEVEATPIDTDRVADAPGLFDAGSTDRAHASADELIACLLSRIYAAGLSRERGKGFGTVALHPAKELGNGGVTQPFQLRNGRLVGLKQRHHRTLVEPLHRTRFPPGRPPKPRTSLAGAEAEFHRPGEGDAGWESVGCALWRFSSPATTIESAALEVSVPDPPETWWKGSARPCLFPSTGLSGIR